MMNDLSFEFVLERLEQQQEVWLLQADNGLFAMVETPDQSPLVPLWVMAEMAEQARTDDWATYQLTSMSLSELIGWLNELQNDGIQTGIVINDTVRVLPFEATQLQDILLDLIHRKDKS
ncbi:MAG: DUF2750 domain-containing protein [Bacteroidales bacterium]|jgi:hypothetical protein|nr:DUF2750 domain-containing protein [Bacteroidales bacterium]